MKFGIRSSQSLQDPLSKVVFVLIRLKELVLPNQRETTVVWDKETGLPIYNAVVWQSAKQLILLTS